MNEKELLSLIPNASSVERSTKPDDATRFLFAPFDRVNFDGILGAQIPNGMIVPVFTWERCHNVMELHNRKNDSAVRWVPNARNPIYGYTKEFPGPIVNEVLRTEAAAQGLSEVDAFDGLSAEVFVKEGLYDLFRFNRTDTNQIVTKAQYEAKLTALLDYEGFGADRVRAAIPQMLAAVERAANWCYRHLDQRMLEIEQALHGKVQFTGYHTNQDQRAMAFVGIPLRSLIEKQSPTQQQAQPQTQNITVNLGPEVIAAIRAGGQQPAAAQEATSASTPVPNDEVKAKLAAMAEEIKAAQGQQARKTRTSPLSVATAAKSAGMRITTPPPEPTE
jgi:hypothetical protein